LTIVIDDTYSKFTQCHLTPVISSFPDLHCIKGLPFSCPLPGCHQPNVTNQSLVSDIPAGDGKIVNLFYIDRSDTGGTLAANPNKASGNFAVDVLLTPVVNNGSSTIRLPKPH
jgi:hypothetical protein